MKYRAFIEEYFMIDRAMTGELVPFTFNPVQNKYYDDLNREYEIEKYGIDVAIREDILKARREGFSSFILSLFAADDILQDNPTETDVLSYKDDATAVFRKRYRTYILSYFGQKAGLSKEQISQNIGELEKIAKQVFSIDATDLELAHNRAHFQSNTASARVGGRGGVRHKLLFSEVAFYPDTPKIKASEMIEATMRQVDIASGWIFAESTENGLGTYQHQMWTASQRGASRFKNRFYGAGEFYTPQEIAIIRSEYVDMDSFRRDYPMTEDDLFKGSAKNYTSEAELQRLVETGKAEKEIIYFLELQEMNGIDVAEIIKSELDRLVRTYPNNALYASIDEAKTVDATVLTVLRDKRMDLRGGIKGLSIDTTRGEFLADWFERNSRYYVLRKRFSRPSKSIMYTNLQAVIAGQLTSIPAWKVNGEWVTPEYKHFFQQMTSLEKEWIGNLLIVHHPNGNCNGGDHDYDNCPYHDDYPDSWAMVEDLYVELNGVPNAQPKPPIPTVPNSISSLLNKPMQDRKVYGTDGYV